MQNLTFTQRAQSLYEAVRRGETITCAYIPLSLDHIQNADQLGSTFQEGQHYFQVQINEMFLANSREFFQKYDPVVFAATEFIYDREMQSVPKVIGPTLLNQYQRALPDGVRYLNTPISGLHPYVGGDLVVVLILYRATRGNYLRNLLNIVDKVVAAIDPSTSLQHYMKIANVILDGIEMILGTNEVHPLVGVRDHINQIGVGKRLTPGYYALIRTPEQTVNPQKLWVLDNRLCSGDSSSNAQPYRDHDFVLFSIAQAKERNDFRTLSFFPHWERAQVQATQTATWNEAKASFNTAWHELLTSPDLTQPQKESLRDFFITKLTDLRNQAKQMEQMGPMRGPKDTAVAAGDWHMLGKLLRDLD
jgi:hypothetical protein